jgi:hypothetical protein
LKILKAIAIMGFLSAAIGQIASVFLPSQGMPLWGFPIFVGIFPVGLAGIFACMRIGRSNGIWGREKQSEYINSKCPKWTNKAALWLLGYILLMFAVSIAKSVSTSAQSLSPFFQDCTGSMVFYVVMVMVFHVASSED